MQDDTVASQLAWLVSETQSNTAALQSVSSEVATLSDIVSARGLETDRAMNETAGKIAALEKTLAVANARFVDQDRRWRASDGQLLATERRLGRCEERLKVFRDGMASLRATQVDHDTLLRSIEGELDTIEDVDELELEVAEGRRRSFQIVQRGHDDTVLRSVPAPALLSAGGVVSEHVAPEAAADPGPESGGRSDAVEFPPQEVEHDYAESRAPPPADGGDAAAAAEATGKEKDPPRGEDAPAASGEAKAPRRKGSLLHSAALRSVASSSAVSSAARRAISSGTTRAARQTTVGHGGDALRRTLLALTKDVARHEERLAAATVAVHALERNCGGALAGLGAMDQALCGSEGRVTRLEAAAARHECETAAALESLKAALESKVSLDAVTSLVGGHTSTTAAAVARQRSVGEALAIRLDDVEGQQRIVDDRVGSLYGTLHGTQVEVNKCLRTIPAAIDAALLQSCTAEDGVVARSIEGKLREAAEQTRPGMAPPCSSASQISAQGDAGCVGTPGGGTGEDADVTDVGRNREVVQRLEAIESAVGMCGKFIGRDDGSDRGGDGPDGDGREERRQRPLVAQIQDMAAELNADRAHVTKQLREDRASNARRIGSLEDGAHSRRTEVARLGDKVGAVMDGLRGVQAQVNDSLSGYTNRITSLELRRGRDRTRLSEVIERVGHELEACPSRRDVTGLLEAATAAWQAEMRRVRHDTETQGRCLSHLRDLVSRHLPTAALYHVPPTADKSVVGSSCLSCGSVILSQEQKVRLIQASIDPESFAVAAGHLKGTFYPQTTVPRDGAAAAEGTHHTLLNVPPPAGTMDAVGDESGPVRALTSSAGLADGGVSSRSAPRASRLGGPQGGGPSQQQHQKHQHKPRKAVGSSTRSGSWRRGGRRPGSAPPTRSRPHQHHRQHHGQHDRRGEQKQSPRLQMAVGGGFGSQEDAADGSPRPRPITTVGAMPGQSRMHTRTAASRHAVGRVAPGGGQGVVVLAPRDTGYL